MKKLVLLSILPAALALSGCDKEVGAPQASFGNAVRQNIEVQRVNPEAPTADAVVVHDAARAAVAQGRYMQDKVEKPREQRTGSVGVSGSGGGK